MGKNIYKVNIIILNWNGWRDTIECLESLLRIAYLNYQIVVIDNNSADGSLEYIKLWADGKLDLWLSPVGKLRDKAFPPVRKPLSYLEHNSGDLITKTLNHKQHFGNTPASHPLILIQTGKNLGFAGGNNVGITYALDQEADFVWLLNNDAVVESDALSKLLEMAETHKEYSFFGSWIAFYDWPDKLWFGGGTFDRLTGKIGNLFGNQYISTLHNRDQLAEVSWITGCSLLVSRKVLEEIGLLDESFFLYSEETEWQLRTNPKKPKALLLNTPLVYHKVGRATGSTDGYLGNLFRSRNYLKLAVKCGFLPIWLVRWFINFLIKPLLKGNISLVGSSLRSLLLLNVPGDQIVRRFK